MAPLGLGDELRAALVAAGSCWGVLCLHRLDAPAGFSSEEIALIRRLVPHLAEGLRRAIVAAAITSPHPAVRGPGVIVLDKDLSISSMNAEAEQRMADLRDPRWMDPGSGSLPTAMHVTAARAASPDPGRDAAAPVTRVRTGSGDWLSIHASRLGGPTGQQTAVVVESARPVQMASLYLDAHGLTPAQSRVAALVLQGRSTRQIVNELHISPTPCKNTSGQSSTSSASAAAVSSSPPFSAHQPDRPATQACRRPEPAATVGFCEPTSEFRRRRSSLEPSARPRRRTPPWSMNQNQAFCARCSAY